MNSHRLPIDVMITDQELDDIVDSAISWCNHWCDSLEYGKEPEQDVLAMSEAITRGGTLVFGIDEPFEEGGETSFELTLDKLLNGIAKYQFHNFGDFDGPMSDEVLQIALFGEVVYA